MVKLPFVPGGDKKFFDLLQEGAKNLTETVQKFEELMSSYDKLEERVKEIMDCEHKGDDIIHEIMRRLHRTFVTPLDRGDIARLAERIDDVVDHIEEAARNMLDYQISAPTPQAKEIAQILVQAGVELDKAISQLPNIRRHQKDILEQCVHIKSQEEKADKVVRSALIELFGDTMAFPEMMKWREVYDQLEEAADSCEGAAIVLEGIVLEHA